MSFYLVHSFLECFHYPSSFDYSLEAIVVKLHHKWSQNFIATVICCTLIQA